MKVHIGRYKNYYGPYQIAETLCFWTKKDAHGDSPDYVYKFGKFLAENKNDQESLLTKICQWVDSKRKQKIKVKIDPWDTWNVDSTLNCIIYPLLVKFREEIQSTGSVDKEDVPESLHSTYGTEDELSAMYSHEAFLYVLDEMIWSFDPEWDDKYGFGAGDCSHEKCLKYQERQQNGFRLFGKYYRNLWS